MPKVLRVVTRADYERHSKRQDRNEVTGHDASGRSIRRTREVFGANEWIRHGIDPIAWSTTGVNRLRGYRFLNWSAFSRAWSYFSAATSDWTSRPSRSSVSSPFGNCR